MNRFVTSYIALIVLVASAATPSARAAQGHSGGPNQRLHESIGQMIMVGFFGTKNTDAGFRQLILNLESGTVGGVLFLGRNISSEADLRTMVQEIRHCRCKRPPLIAVDEEGGIVQRLGSRIGLAETPSAAKIGAGNASTARGEYARLSKKLASLGFNLNLAPVVDLNTNKSNPVIGGLNRSFSERPEIVSRYASIFIEEHHRRGLAIALKHFPGHGSSLQDSHKEATDVEATWSPAELTPYRTLIRTGIVDAVLVGHLTNRARWGGMATQSEGRAIKEMLRKQLSFRGVVLSDDLIMDAVRANHVTLADAAISAVNAGVDIVIVSRLDDESEKLDAGTVINHSIQQAVISGRISRSAILQSSRRIRSLKASFAR